MAKDLRDKGGRAPKPLEKAGKAQSPSNEGSTNPALLHTVARLHYLSDLSQVEIARRLELSPATISRLLQRAREVGIVQIEIRDLVDPHETASQLMQDLTLRHAVVVDPPEAAASAALAAPVGAILKEVGVGQGSVLAIGWGRAVREVIRAGLPRMPGVVTVPATGGMQQAAPHFQINEFVRLAAQQMSGTPRFIHAPYLPSSKSREAFLDDPTIRDQIALWDRVDAAIVGVGLPHAVDPVHASAATSYERALLHAAGDVIRHYYDADGELISWEGDRRLIALSPAQLRSIPTVIGVAVGPAKASAIIGAIKAKLINALVTDARTAQAMLALLGRPAN